MIDSLQTKISLPDRLLIPKQVSAQVYEKE